jgi:hypothetical protein
MDYIHLLRINTAVNTDTLPPTQFYVTHFLTYAGKEWIKTRIEFFSGGNESVMRCSWWRNTAGRWQAARKSCCGLSVSSVLCYEFHFKLHPHSTYICSWLHVHSVPICAEPDRNYCVSRGTVCTGDVWTTETAYFHERSCTLALSQYSLFSLISNSVTCSNVCGQELEWNDSNASVILT